MTQNKNTKTMLLHTDWTNKKTLITICNRPNHTHTHTDVLALFNFLYSQELTDNGCVHTLKSECCACGQWKANAKPKPKAKPGKGDGPRPRPRRHVRDAAARARRRRLADYSVQWQCLNTSIGLAQASASGSGSNSETVSDRKSVSDLVLDIDIVLVSGDVVVSGSRPRPTANQRLRQSLRKVITMHCTTTRYSISTTKSHGTFGIDI